MATQYTSLLGLALPVTGELSGTWGDTVNDSITSLLDTAVAGTTTLNTDSDVTLSTTTGVANQARQAIILWTANGTTTRNITAPAQSKIYTVINASAGTQSIVFRGVGPTTGVTIVKGESALVAWNGSDFIKISNTGGAASFTNVTVSGTTTLSGLTASTALALNASKEVVSVTNTGTGNNVLSASPTLTGTVAGASLQLSSLTSGRVTYAGASGLLQDSANLTFNGTTLTANALTTTSTVTINGGTANGVAYLNGSKVLTTGSALTFDGTNLGIGTSSPKGKVSINVGASGSSTLGDLATAGVTLIGAGGSGNISQIGLGAYSTSLTYSPTAIGYVATNTTGNNYGDLVFATRNVNTDTAPTERMRLDSSGNLGIGTSSPATRLHVTTGATGAQALFSHTSGTPTIAVGNSTTTYNTQIGYNVGSEYGYIQAVAAAGVYDDIAINPLGGNVGIGTSSPNEKLEVYGASAGVLRLSTAAKAFNIYTNNSDGALYFRDVVASTNRMALDSSGNLGIGTSSPAQLLDVQSASSPTIRISNSKEWGSGDSGVIGAYQFYTKDASTPNGTKIAAYINAENYAGSSVPEGILTFGTSAGGGSSANATEKMRLDASGNLGLGVTPSAWGSIYRAMQLGTGASIYGRSDSSSVVVGQNMYRDASNVFTYVTTAAAGYYQIGSGIHSWHTAASGTGGTGPISFTQAMTLDASGRLGIGVTGPTQKLQVSDGTYSNFYVAPGYGSGSGTLVGVGGSEYLAFATNGLANERARITSGGFFGLGVTPSYPIQATLSNASDWFAFFTNSSATAPYGLVMKYSGASPNGTASSFYLGSDTTATRFEVRSNGGIANYSANDVNLSDRREKTNFAPAKSYLDTICAIPVQTFNYIDQSENDPGLTLGVVAQDVQAVAPELVMESNWGTKEDPKMRLSIYQTDLQYALMKALQELKAEFDAYKATHP